MEVKLYQGLLELNWNLLFSLITVLVLFLILSKFFFKKVRRFMENREKDVAKQFTDAEQKNKQADQLLKDYEEKMNGAEAERDEILKQGRSDAEKQAREIIDDANQKAAERLRRADEEIEHDREIAERSLKSQMTDLVKLATQKVLEESMDDSRQDEIINEAIQNTGGDHEGSGDGN